MRSYSASTIIVGSVALLLVCADARAAGGEPDGVGVEGTFTISVERLAGVTHVVDQQTPRSGSGDFHTTVVSLLANPFTSFGSPQSAPRFAFDYTVVDRFTVGGALSFARASNDIGDEPKSVFVAARAGYVLPLATRIDLWIRGGLSYWTLSGNGSGFHEMDLTIDPKVVFGLAPHFGVTVGAFADIGLTSGDSGFVVDKFTSYGLDLGLSGWL